MEHVMGANRNMRERDDGLHHRIPNPHRLAQPVEETHAVLPAIAVSAALVEGEEREARVAKRAHGRHDDGHEKHDT